MSSTCSFRRASVFAALLTLVLALVGCQRTPIMAQKINAESEKAFANWQTRLREDFSREQAQEFEEALQEVRLQIMAAGKVTGSEAIAEAMRKKIHDATVREVLRDAMLLKARRLSVQRVELETFMQQNSSFRPVDDASAAYLEKKRAEQQGRLDKIKAEILAAENRVKALSLVEPAK